MAFEPYSRVDFGPGSAGLSTVGYTLYKDGRPLGPRVVAGVDDLGGGHYGAAIRFPSHFRGKLVWDTGGPTPRSVRFSVSPEDGSKLDTRIPGPGSPAPRARTARPPTPALTRDRPPVAVAGLPAQVRTAAPPCTVAPSRASVAMVDEIPLSPRLRTVVLPGGTRPTLEWTMTSSDCGPIDLTPCGVGGGGTVIGTLRCSPDCFNYVVDFPAASPNPGSGLMAAEVDPQRLGGPGIYDAEMGVMAADGDYIAYSNRFFLLLEPGLFGQLPENGPPTIAEIRLALRDSSPLENELLDDSLAFDNSEIVVAMRDVVDYWNEALPPLSARFTTQNFPFRYWWKQGAKAVLFRTAAEHHRRNDVEYQAGGVSYNEHAQKAQQYDAAADAIWTEFTQWVRGRKMAINLNDGWLDFTSPYSREW
jgi:hypothetical protein